MDLPALLTQAARHLQRNETEAAEKLCRKVLRRDRRQPDANHFLGLILLRRGHAAEAVTHLRLAMKGRPDQASIAVNLGAALNAEGDFIAAEQAFRHAVKTDPSAGTAWSNLGRVLMKQDRAADAAAPLREAVKLAPQAAAGHVELGAALLSAKDLTAAEESLREALRLDPHNLKALRNLAMTLSEAGRGEEALTLIDQAIADGQSGLDGLRALALHRLGRSDDAIETLTSLCRRQPEDTDSHELLKRLLWLREGNSSCLDEMKAAAERLPDSLVLQLEYAGSLMQLDQPQPALEVLEAARRRHGNDPALMHAYASALVGNRRVTEAVPMLEQVVAQTGHVRPRITLSRALLGLGEPQRAIAQLRELVKMRPLDQEIWAYLATAYRLADDRRSAWLNDVDRLVDFRAVPVPDGFADAADFNAALAERLLPMHDSAAHPIEQTVRGGTQTEGNIFTRGDSLLTALKESLEASIAAFVAELPDDPDHPTLGRKSSAFRLKGGWSVRLRADGFHTNHVHPDGWLSSAYYVSLPPAVTDPVDSAGHLQFGRPDLTLGVDLDPLRTIAPEIGHLALFPSYMWHGTVPFSDPAPRLTVAFDVVPLT